MSMRQIHVAAALALLFGTLPSRAPDCLADTVNGGVYNVTDEKARFVADGWWETLDVGNDGLNGPEFEIQDPQTDDKWIFYIKHATVSPHWNEQLAVGVHVGLRGWHLQGPHDAIDQDPNRLPLIQSELRNVLFAVGGGQKFTKSGKVDHPAGAGVKHKDVYSFTASVIAVKGTNNKLGGTWDVEGHHEGDEPAPPAVPIDMGFGSGIPSGSHVVFNGGTGTLTLGVTGINIMDAIGGLSEGIDPLYATDPFQGGLFTITDMHYLGLDPDGRFRFSGCEAVVTDPLGNFSFQAGFDEYVIDNTASATAVTSYARYDSISIVDVSEPSEGQSLFLSHFTSLDIMGEGYSASEWMGIQGVMLTFITETNLALATNGFTESATMPATVVISSSRGIPAPVFSSRGRVLLPLVLVALAAVMILSRARRGRS